jgi:DNA-binding beta-propeller fold protein YncE
VDDTALLFDDTTFVSRGAIPYELYGCERLGNSSQIIGLEIQEGSSVPLLGRMLIYDLVMGELVDSFMIDPLGNGTGFSFATFDISPDGRYLYAVGGDQSGDWVLGFDIPNKSVLFKYPKIGRNPGAMPNVAPDGGELWVTWGANAFFLPWPEWVHVLDARSGTVIDSIDVRSSTIGWPRPVSPTEIRFSPEGDKAYIACGTGFTGTQPLLIVDKTSHDVSKVVFADFGRIPRRIAIGPSR